jgi:hypothetical protein
LAKSLLYHFAEKIMNKTFLFSLFCLLTLQFPNTIWSQPNPSDCDGARILCDLAPVSVSELSDFGELPEMITGQCFPDGFEETNSIWFKWKVAESGTLSFVILPINEHDDLDFVVYRQKDIEICSIMEPIRCMASGPNLGVANDSSKGCTGATGLKDGIESNLQTNGCPSDGENFLRPLDVQAGESYTLFVNNFRSKGGFVIEWGGTASFQKLPQHCASQTTPIISSQTHKDKKLQLSDVFPNPATELVSISTYSTENLSGQLQVIGADGQIEMIIPAVISAGHSILELSTVPLTKGVHFVKLRTNDESHLLRFVKH